MRAMLIPTINKTISKQRVAPMTVCSTERTFREKSNTRRRTCTFLFNVCGLFMCTSICGWDCLRCNAITNNTRTASSHIASNYVVAIGGDGDDDNIFPVVCMGPKSNAI